jgi:hypothetical protein
MRSGGQASASLSELWPPSARCARTARTWPRGRRAAVRARTAACARAPGAIRHHQLHQVKERLGHPVAAFCCCPDWDTFRAAKPMTVPGVARWSPPTGLEERDDGR